MADTYQVGIKGLVNLANQNIEFAIPDLAGTPDYSCYNVLLVAGDNLITLPSTAKYLLLQFSAQNTSVMKLKHATGDSGITLLIGGVILLALPIGNFIILTLDINDVYSTKVITF